jgi:hypothetical protein
MMAGGALLMIAGYFLKDDRTSSIRSGLEAILRNRTFSQRSFTRRLNLRRHFFQADEAGERAHFALLILTQLEQ